MSRPKASKKNRRVTKKTELVVTERLVVHYLTDTLLMIKKCLNNT